MKSDHREPELVSFLPALSLNRRDVLVTTLATGFALAVQPISAQTITTDAEGLIAGEVQIPVAGGTVPAYRAMPEKGKKLPVVLVVQALLFADGGLNTGTFTSSGAVTQVPVPVVDAIIAPLLTFP